MPVAKVKWPRVVELALMGKGPTEIGKALGCSPQVAHATLRLTEVREQIDAANEEAFSRILDRRAKLAGLGIDTLVELAEGRPYLEVDDDGLEVTRYDVPDSVRRQSASDLCDRMGVTKETALNVTGSTPIIIDASGMTPEQLKAAIGDD